MLKRIKSIAAKSLAYAGVDVSAHERGSAALEDIVPLNNECVWRKIEYELNTFAVTRTQSMHQQRLSLR